MNHTSTAPRFHQTQHGRTVAKFIHACRQEGKSFDAIAKGLQALKVANSRGRASWSVGAVYPLYRDVYGVRALLGSQRVGLAVKHKLTTFRTGRPRARFKKLSGGIQRAAQHISLKSAVAHCELEIESAIRVKQVPA